MATGSSAPANITIPYSLYCALYLYFCTDGEVRNIPTVETFIRDGLTERQERLDRRNAFSDYRNETDENQKRRLLADYLDMTGIPADFRPVPRPDQTAGQDHDRQQE
jgi:hypothetical protein